jgi:hypothetical protein
MRLRRFDFQRFHDMRMSQRVNLSCRMKILCAPRDQSPMKQQTLQWYTRYAEAVLKALRHSRFQQFLGALLRHEHISLRRIKAIHIRTFPRTKANGRHLNGTATSKGIIALYPPTMPKTVGDRNMHRSKGFSLTYVQWRARATLIHEILHYKYRHREHHVRQLAQQYTQRCMQPKTCAMKRVFKRIFQTPIRPDRAGSPCDL